MRNPDFAKARRRIWPAIALVFSIAACGGGGGGGSAAPADGAAVAMGVAAVGAGSIVVNGVAFAIPPGTPVRVDDVASTGTALLDGMVVKVRGTINTDGSTGTAAKIESEDEIEGPADSLLPADGMFLVLGHTVFVDDLTVFAGTTGLSGADPIVASDVVEVHGFRDGAGAIRASRVGRKAPGQEAVDVKGKVANLSAGSFNVGPTLVIFAPAIAPPGLANGISVEAKGTPTGPASIAASMIEREDLEDAEFEPRDKETFSVGGFTAGAGDIFVNGRKVTTTNATKFRNGARADLEDGIRVQATGTMVGTELEADTIAYHRTRIRMRALANVVDPVAQTVVLFTNTAHVDIHSRLGAPLAGIVGGSDRLEFLGYQDAQGRLVADRLSPIGEEEDVLQGRVESVTSSSFVILGLQVGTVPDGSTATKFRNPDDDIVTSADFFGAVMPSSVAPPGTLVKVTGEFTGGIIPMVAREAKEED